MTLRQPTLPGPLLGSLLCSLLSCAAAAPAQEGGNAERRNWFNDPFFQATDQVPNCPAPLGPFITEREKLAQTHHRAEKGTTCWLAGQCEKPNFYAYDPAIAQALRATLAAAADARRPSSLWVTVQGRVVYIEGCVADAAAERELEALARGVDHVQQAIAIVTTDPNGRIPYRRAAAPFKLVAPNPVPITPRLVTSGQPDAATLATLAAQGFGGVIHLAPLTTSDAVPDEPAILARQGLGYVNIPIRFDNPTPADFDAFVAALQAQGPRKVLVHCQLNFRASSMVFLYRVIVGHEPVEAAYDAVAKVWSPEGAWKDFIVAQLRRHGIDFEPY